MPNRCFLYSSALRLHVLSRLAHRQQICNKQPSEGETVFLNILISLMPDLAALSQENCHTKSSEAAACHVPCPLNLSL